jgi:putative flippase GtrA
MTIKAAMSQLLRFSSIGLGASALYFIFALVLESVVQMPVVLASFLAYTGAAVFGFFGHRIFTFASTNNPKSEIVRFGIATAIGMCLAIIIPLLLKGYPPVVAFIAVLLIVPIVSFILMKFFVFSGS